MTESVSLLVLKEPHHWGAPVSTPERPIEGTTLHDCDEDPTEVGFVPEQPIVCELKNTAVSGTHKSRMYWEKYLENIVVTGMTPRNYYGPGTTERSI